MLAGGSNVVVADAGFPGTVVRVLTRGVRRDGERIEVQAGEPWDELVAMTAWRRACRASSACRASPARPARRRSRTSAPTGRRSPRPSSRCACWTARAGRSPSSPRPTAASPTARASSSTATATSCSPSRSGCASRASPARCATPSWRARWTCPVGGSAPLADVREAVLALRRGKGMVIDPADPDSVSAGSFFTNPILDPGGFARAGVADRRRRQPARVPGARRPHQDVGRLADRARRLPARLRRRARRHLDQAHARARQPRRRDDRRADGARARDRRRRAGALRGPPHPRAGARGPRLVALATA